MPNQAYHHLYIKKYSEMYKITHKIIIIQPFLRFRNENSILSQRTVKRLKVVIRKLLRRILGPIYRRGVEV